MIEIVFFRPLVTKESERRTTNLALHRSSPDLILMLLPTLREVLEPAVSGLQTLGQRFVEGLIKQGIISSNSCLVPRSVVRRGGVEMAPMKTIAEMTWKPELV